MLCAEQQCVVEWRVPGTGSKKHKQQKSCHDAILVRISGMFIVTISCITSSCVSVYAFYLCLFDVV